MLFISLVRVILLPSLQLRTSTKMSACHTSCRDHLRMKAVQLAYVREK